MPHMNSRHRNAFVRCANRIAISAALLTSLMVGTTHAADVEKAKLNFGIQPTMDYAPVVLGIKEGFFAKEGLQIEYQLTTSQASLNGILGGTFDAAGVNSFSFLTAFNRGLPVVGISELDRGMPGYTSFVVKGDSPIKTKADFVGKKLGVLAKNGNCDLILNDQLGKEGIAFDKIEYVALGVPELLSTLLTGGIDAACIPEPMLSGAVKKNGLRPVFDLFSGPYSDFPIVSYSVSQQFKAANPKTFAALQRAMAVSLKFAHDNPEKIRAILSTYTTIDQETAKGVVLPGYPEKSNPARLSVVADIMTTLKVLGGTVKVPTE